MAKNGHECGASWKTPGKMDGVQEDLQEMRDGEPW